jgi:hypothetical protein
MTRQRLDSLRRRLSRDQILHEMYKTNMNELLSKSYAEAVLENDVKKPDGAAWYLPHHPVLNKNKPGKVRVVFYCAAIHRGISLNSKVLQGPDLTSKLIGVLLRFRQEKIAVTADIESMFHQVRVNQHHRDYLRFLWWPDGDLSEDARIYIMNVHLFGGVWSPNCCSFALKYTAEQHQSEFDKETVESVNNDFYVDDFLKSCTSAQQASRLVTQLCSLLSMGGFRLTKWVSNSHEVLSKIPEAERSAKICSLHLLDGS